MIGVEQAGVAETIDYVFKKFSSEDQNRLAQVNRTAILKEKIFFAYPTRFSVIFTGYGYFRLTPLRA